MIGLHCDTCDAPLVLTAGVSEAGELLVYVHEYTECKCTYTPTELADILSDAYIEEM